MLREPSLPPHRGDNSGYISYDEMLRIAWRRKSLLCFGMAIAIVMGAIYYVQKRPVYQSEAQVLVVQKRPESVTGKQGAASQVEDFVSTHRILVKSPIIVADAVEKNNLASLDCLRNLKRDATTEIIERMTVSRVSRESDGVMEVSFRSEDEEACELVLNSILASYKDFLQDTYKDLTQDTVKLIAEARDVLENDLQVKESAYREFRKETPLISTSYNQDVNPSLDRLATIESQRSELMLLHADMESRLAIVENATKSDRSDQDVLVLISKQANDPTWTAQAPASGAQERLGTELLPLMLEEERLLQEYGPNHPDVVAIGERIAIARKFLVLPSSPYEAAAENNQNSEKLIQQYLTDARQEVQRVKASVDKLDKLYQLEYKKAREFALLELQDEQYRTDLRRGQDLYDGLIERLHQASLVKDFGGFEARIIAPAKIGEKIAPRKIYVFPACLLAGLVLGGALAFMAEYQDRGFHSPDEIQMHLDLSVLGHVPMFKSASGRELKKAGVGDGHLATVLKPRSIAAESYRAIRTALYFNAGPADVKVIQVTSPSPSDGKSTLISNLAVSMAKSGRKVLLVDADLRKPRQHRVFGIENRSGLANVISGTASAKDTIVESEIENLAVLPSGPEPSDPAELLTKPEFGELFKQLREHYEYILVDTAPVLAVTDPAIVAAAVDGTVLTMRIHKSSKVQSERTLEVLAGVGSNLLGIVVNGVSPKGNSYSNYEGYGDVYGRNAKAYFVEDA